MKDKPVRPVGPVGPVGQVRQTARLDIAAIRAQFQANGGRGRWQGLEQFTETPQQWELSQREFTPGMLEDPGPVDRRDFFKIMGAALALAGLNGCTKPSMKEIVPYVEQPPEIVLGEPLYFATAMPLSGFGTGMLVKSREGRPIKADGNPKHPASLGGSSVWMQACLLDLYDPVRAKAVTQFGQPSSWGIFLGGLNEALRAQEQNHGAGLRILTGTVTSPTLGAQLETVLKRYPEARWHQYEPINQDNPLAGARLAFGRDIATHYRFDRAQVILSLGSDFMYTHPERLRYSRQFSDQRRVVANGPQMNRLYAIESTPSITGSNADNRLPLSPRRLEAAAWQLARALGLSVPADARGQSLADAPAQWVAEVARELRARAGDCLVTVGEFQSPALHDLEHRLNETLSNVGRTVYYTARPEFRPVIQIESLRELVQAMAQGKVELLLMLGINPVYESPADFEFAQHLKQVKHTVHLSLDYDETSALSEWHIPQTHFLETWGDIRSYDGTVTIQQPLIAPLFGGKSEYELLSVLEKLQPLRPSYDIVRDYWRAQNLWPEFESGWRRSVQNGVVEGTQLQPITARLQPMKSSAADAGTSAMSPGTLEVVFRPDPSLWDGRFSDNPWLQETPKPFTKITWDNAVLISPRLAEQAHLSNGDIVELTFEQRRVEGAVWVLPGQADDTATLHLGYGQRRAGYTAAVVGFNCYLLRTSSTPWQGEGLTLTSTGDRYQFATVQLHQRLHQAERQVYRQGTLEEYRKEPMFVKKTLEVPAVEETLYYPDQHAWPLKWGMAIDLTTCIGCNACLMACNIENNIPVVGKDQVARGRIMVWLRVDTYYVGSLDHPEYNYQPVPCMHCANAPCEYVCPVEAAVHDHEGLNLQVYNRCIGTRYCSNNCPYKVRRFNFLGYTAMMPPLLALRQNPEVSVRSRGVMEKCTYCLQRIAAARIKAGEEKRPVREGEVHTACQEACPTSAIVFGIMTEPDSTVSKYKGHALEYPMLGEVNTRPRTTYLARLRNPNPALPSHAAAQQAKEE